MADITDCARCGHRRFYHGGFTGMPCEYMDTDPFTNPKMHGCKCPAFDDRCPTDPKAPCDYCDHSRTSHERDANGKRTTTGHCSARVALGDGVSGSCSCTAYVEAA